MTAMRMGQGVDVVMNGYAMGAQNNQQQAGLAAAQAAAAVVNRFRPTIGAPTPMMMPQQPMPTAAAVVPRVAQVVAPVPGARLPEKAPVHSLTVQVSCCCRGVSPPLIDPIPTADIHAIVLPSPLTHPLCRSSRS